MAKDAEHKSLVYRTVRAIFRFALFIFFQKIDIRRSKNIPDRGPVVFVANHPNSIMDAFVLGFGTQRKVHYIAHAGLFRQPLFRWFLRNMGVIPVYRQVDDPDKMEQNERMFDACTDVLSRGGAIGIFPEGVSDMERRLKKIKTGAARIVLGAEAAHQFNLGTRLIPVGIHFFSRSRFRSWVLLNFGEAIDLKPFIARYQQDAFAAVNELTDTVRREMEALTVHIEDDELDLFIRDVEQLYRDELRTVRKERGSSKEKAFREKFIISKAIADGVQYFHRHQPELVEQMKEQVAAYKRKLQRLQLHDAMLRDTASQRGLWKQVATAYGQAALGFLPAAYGVLNNFLPYRIAERIARRFIDERTKILTALLFGGGLAFVFFYAIQTTLVGYFAGLTWALIYLLSLPLTGFYALTFIKMIRQHKKKISFSFYIFTNRHLLNRMRRQRRQLIMQFDTIRDEYLKRTAESDVDAAQ